MPLVLNLGSGRGEVLNPVFPEGAEVLCLDIDPAVGPDIVGDVQWVPLADGSVDVAFASHVLEHIAWPRAVTVLKEWVRIIVPGGELHVVAPDMEWVAERLIGGDGSMLLQSIMFGSQGNEFQVHKTGYALALLQDLMGQAGLTVVHGERRERGLMLTMSRGGKNFEERGMMGEIYVVGRKGDNIARKMED